MKLTKQGLKNRKEFIKFAITKAGHKKTFDWLKDRQKLKIINALCAEREGNQ